MFLGRFEIDDYLTFPANTHAPGTGAATDADSPPTYRVYEDETGTPILTGTMAKLDDAGTVGFYSERIQLTAANGLEVGKSYTIYVTAAVGGVTGTMSHHFEMEINTWDTVLTGATFNIPSSAGRRLRQIEDVGGYQLGRIWIDTVNGASGAVDYINGTYLNPVDNIADANTLAASLGISTFNVAPGSTFTFAASQDGESFIGENWTLALGGQSVSGTFIHGAEVSGVATGANPPKFENCSIGTCTLPAHHLESCGISGDITMGSAGDVFWDSCYSEIAGTATPSFDYGAAVANTNFSNRHYSGGLEIKNMGATITDTMSMEGMGQLVINANCAAGTVAMRGLFTVTDNASGALTLSDDARIDVGQVNAEMVDVIFTDTINQLSQGAPAATPTIATGLMLLYMMARNKTTQSDSEYKLYADDGSTVIAKGPVNKAASLFTMSELVTGP
jgi:hypothetical protein